MRAGDSTRLVVGLGNPGPRYAGTRHNVGFLVLERLAERHRITLDEQAYEGRLGRGFVGPCPVALFEPLTFMNASGEAVAQACRGLGVDEISRDLLLVFDDVDLPFGRLRLRPAGGAGGHRGALDVIERLGRRDFARLRFGVGRSGADTVDHVLGGFGAAEREELPRHLERAAEALEVALRDGVAAAMNRFNTASPEAREEADASASD